MVWQKRYIYNDPSSARYEWVDGTYTIDVSMMGQKYQGLPASNQVNVFGNMYGGYLLGTPRNFRTIKQAEAFVAVAKRQLAVGKLGHKVPFMI